MAKELKTKSAPFDRADFLARIETAQRRTETEQLIALFAEVTGWEPRLWGPSIVGFGRYAYSYDSGHEAEFLATGFSPRKAELSIYVLPGYDAFGPNLSRLGPHRTGKSCLYIKHLHQVDLAVLSDLIRAGLADLGARWPVHPV